MEVLQPIGQVLLCDEMVGIVVGIEISVVIVQLLHQFRGRIAQVQGHGQISCFRNHVEGGVNGKLCRVAFRTCSKVHRCFGQGDASFGPPDFIYRIEGGICQQQGVGVCQSDVFSSRDD